MDLLSRIRRSSVLACRMALDQVQTVAGALRIRAAEQGGRARPVVLRAADQRIAALRGEEGRDMPRVVVAAEALDADRRAWEAARQPERRIVEAVGRGHWTGRL